MHGYGKLFYDKGSVIEAYFENGKLVDGYRTYQDKDSSISGYFKDDLLNGYAKFVLSNGVYEGTFKEGKYNGYGRYQSESFLYEGQFKDWKFHGVGTATFTNGNTFHGSIG